MHYMHVNYKEPSMNPITLEDFHNDPELQFRLQAAAQRERARLLRAGLHWLRGRLTPRLPALPLRWLHRLG
jgi:hypothetical protein